MVTTMEGMTITIPTTRGDINLATTTLPATTLTSTTVDTPILHTTTPTDSTTGETIPGITRAIPTDRRTLDITQDITTTQNILMETIPHIVGTIQALTSIITAIKKTIPIILLTTTDITIQDTTRADSTIVLVSTAAVMLPGQARISK